MDRRAYIEKRARRKMAQLLDLYEKTIEPWVPREVSEEFKREVRRKVQALAADCADVAELKDDTEINGVAVQIRDRIGA